MAFNSFTSNARSDTRSTIVIKWYSTAWSNLSGVRIIRDPFDDCRHGGHFLGNIVGTCVAKSSRMIGAAVGAAGKTDCAHTGGDTRADTGDAVFNDEAAVGLKAHRFGSMEE